MTLLLAVAAPASTSAQQAEEGYFLERARRAAPSPTAVRSDGVAEGSLGSQPMRRANRVASQVLRSRMASRRADDLALLDDARTAEVIVVRGQFDRVQDVLTALEVDHVAIPPRLVDDVPLMITQTLMVNCAGNLGAAGAEQVRAHVEGGGLLVTTDWALRLVTRAFPDTIRRGGIDTGDDVVDVEVVQPEHPYLEHVHSTDDSLRWWLEGSSYPIDIIDERRVQVLLSSQQMERRYGRAPVVVTFPQGDGRVLHTTSHFFLQQSRLSTERDRAQGSAFARDLGLDEDALRELRASGLDEVRVGEVAGAYAMQQLLTNALVEKRRQNDELLNRYGLRVSAAAELRSGLDGDAEVVGELREGFLLRELEERGGFVRVRDLFAREGWVDAALVEDRFPPPAEPEPVAAPAPIPAPTVPAEPAAPPPARAGCSVADVAPFGVVPVAFLAIWVLARRRR